MTKRSLTKQEKDDYEGNIEELDDIFGDEKEIKKREYKKKNPQHYIDPTEFSELIVTYYKTNHIPDKLAEMISNIANRLSFAPNFINYCVDSETEALTQRGWLTYQQITTDDIILAYNTDNKNLEWSPIKEIFINEKYNGQMHHLTTKGLDALVTPGHRFVSVEDGLKPVEHIKCGEHIVLNGLSLNNTHKINSDDEVEIIGWAVTEGNYIYGKTTDEVTIFQKIGDKSDRIRNCLKRLKAHYKEYYWDKEHKMVGFRITKDVANFITKNSPHRILNHDFIVKLTSDQRMLLIKTMIDGDGWTRKHANGLNKTNWSYTQKDKQHIDSFLMLCTLSGLTTTTRLVKNTSNYSNTPYYVVNIYSQPKLYCKSDCINLHGGRPKPGGDNRSSIQTKGKLGNPNTPTVPYSGTVWCPKTNFNTFVCRRNGTIFVTGNTYKEEMIGDALVKMFTALKNHKFDPKRGNPFSYYTIIAYRSFINRIKKEKKEAETVTIYKTEVYDALLDSGHIPPEHGPHEHEIGFEE